MTTVSIEDLPQLWEYIVDPPPRMELLSPFEINELTDDNIQCLIKTARKKADPLIKSFGLLDVNKFEQNKISTYNRLVLGRTIQSIYN